MEQQKNSFKNIAILGGGPAGLAVGYFAKKKNFPFTIYEEADHLGGNCITLKHGNFSFDSGAHRLHDKDPEMTAELKSLLGDDLMKIEVPSQIYHNGRFIDFPLSPLNLLLGLGLITSFRATLSLLKAKLNPIDNNPVGE